MSNKKKVSNKKERMPKEKLSKEQKKPQQQSYSFFKEMKCFIQPYSGKFSASVVISILSVLSNLASYVFIGLIIGLAFDFIGFIGGDGAQWGRENISLVVVFAGGAVCCKIIHALLLNFSTLISHRAAYHTLRDIRLAVVQKFKRLPLGYFETKGSGRLNTVIVDKIESMEVTLAHVLPELTANLLCPGLLLLWMFFIDWRIGLVVLIWIILGLCLSGGMFVGYEEKYAGMLKAFKGMNQSIVEYVGGIEVIKNFGRDDACYKKYEDSIHNYSNYNINWRRETQKYSAAGMCMAPYPLFPVLIFGLIFFGNGSLDISALFLLTIQSLGIFQPFMTAMGYFDQLAMMGTNAKEIKDILDYKEVARGTWDAFDNFNVEYKNVSFSYMADASGGPSELALKGVNLSINEGEMVALVGPSGGGKSTIGKLLGGYFDVGGGEITIGGRQLSAYSQNALNKEIAYVDQDTFLFNQSILDNVRLGCPNATDEEIIEICKKAGCHEFISALPEGYNTNAGIGGQKLSGGERQRICIARAMAKDAKIIILDEATSSSDPENEDKIQQALSASCKGKTLVVIAHRLKTIVNADKIAFVKEGKITHIGTHKELLNSCPDYKNMWEAAQGEKND